VTCGDLGDLELACLKSLRIASLPASDCCPPEVLARLLDYGLIKEVPVVRLHPPGGARAGNATPERRTR